MAALGEPAARRATIVLHAWLTALAVHEAIRSRAARGSSVAALTVLWLRAASAEAERDQQRDCAL
jgi:hypothetical protein